MLFLNFVLSFWRAEFVFLVCFLDRPYLHLLICMHTLLLALFIYFYFWVILYIFLCF